MAGMRPHDAPQERLPLALGQRPRPVAGMARAPQERGAAVTIIAWVCAPLAAFGLTGLLWLHQSVRREKKRRCEHTRLSRRQRKAWEAIKAGNRDVAATGAYIAAREERGHPQ